MRYRLNIPSFLGLTWATLALTAPCGLEDSENDGIIQRDVCVIGGGATGTYAAIRLRDMGESVVLVENKGRLGGHTETYIDQNTRVPMDLGVKIFHDIDIVRNYFARFNLSLTKDILPPSPQKWVDFSTGNPVPGYAPADLAALVSSLDGWSAQLEKYPGLAGGFNLPEPVPSDLLLPFGDFVKKYGLDSSVRAIIQLSQTYTLFQFLQSQGDLLSQLTLYVLKLIGPDMVSSMQNGFLTTSHHNNSELYWRATGELGPDVLLNTQILSVSRPSVHGHGRIEVAVQTPAGRRLIKARNLVVTIPPTLASLSPFDLDKNERGLFAQFHTAGLTAAVLRSPASGDTGLPANMSFKNVGANTPYHLPVLPGLYSIEPTGVAGLSSATYGSPFGNETDEAVKSTILTTIRRVVPSATPEIVFLSQHSPYQLTVSAEAIKDGFYDRLYRLQGKRGTYWTGAAWNAHDSSVLWRFTEKMVVKNLVW